jgi:PAS domain S-box-containing protein
VTAETLKHLLEDSTDIIYVHDLVGRILFLNRAALTRLGYHAEDCTHLTLRDLLPPEGFERALALTGQIARGEREAGPFITELRRRDGSHVTVEVHMRLVADSQGFPSGVQGVAREVSPGQTREERHQALDSSSQTVLSEIDSGRLFPLVVRRAQETLSADATVLVLAEGRGFSVGASVGIPEGGSTLDPLMTGAWPNQIVGTDRPIVVTDLLQDATLGKSTLVRRLGFRRLIAMPLGVPGERLGCLALLFRSPRVVRADELSLLQTFGQEVALAVKNARVYAEAQRRRQNAETLARVIGGLLTLRDLNGVIQQVVEGARELAEADCSALIVESSPGSSLQTLGTSGTMQPLKDGQIGLSQGVARLVLETHRPFLSENALADPRIDQIGDDSVVREGIVGIAAVPVFLKENRRGILQVAYRSSRWIPIDLVERLTRFAHSAAMAVEHCRVHSILERQIQDLQLAQAQMVHTGRVAAFGQWAAALAHAIKSPLAAIMGFAELAARRFPEKDENRQALETIMQETERLDQIVARQLAFVRAGSTAMVPLDATQLVSEAVQLFSGVLEREKVQVEMNLTGGLAKVFGDRWQLEEVLMNLLSNAVDAMPEGGHLRVWTRQGPEGMIEIGLADSGHGIAPAHRDAIWEPFFTTKPQGKGTGLGLPLSRSMIAQHGGSISLQSEEGRGTTVRIWLPTIDLK